MTSGRVDVVNSNGCSRLFHGFSASVSSLNGFRLTHIMPPASSAISEPLIPGPFAGLVICVTGLSKEARMQVMAATKRLGGNYSSSLHPQCTHLVVQSFYGRKFEHALKHGSRNGLFIVTLGWFVDSVRRNGELNQLAGLPGAEKSCLPTGVFEDEKSMSRIWQNHQQCSRKELRSSGAVLSGDCIYVDSDTSTELKKKVVDAATREGAMILEQWFIGCPASHVVCEGPSIWRYIGHTNHLVTPLWILKTVKEKSLQRLVHLSSDLARQVGMVLENGQITLNQQDAYGENTDQVSMSSRKSLLYTKGKETLEERQKLVDMAKSCIRTRRSHRMQSCQMPIHPITPNSLMDSICWSVSEPTSTARIYTESSSTDDATEQYTSMFFDARADGRDSEVLLDNFSRPLSESEKGEVIFKNHFLTILFPVDRFGELGPSSRTFFSNGGFSCLQVLDYIYNFYQQNMAAEEIDMAIHTDSRHADRLRSLYASKESVDLGFVSFKRIEFLGSRRSFEALKRVSGENNSNLYQLLIRA
ncbi:uncharacterized protein LOC109822485 isoform X2 [Asparagus officinalis]|uniref:uncharacterized protein LOC109822485 isoform X2 n=1 Tax=Asparagus officinalis TaxID=4686 RepID=UPI00098E2EFC|nr:uncharacterized protein LOC109822485 isoform X2 [Asparagus officinalis]